MKTHDETFGASQTLQLFKRTNAPLCLLSLKFQVQPNTATTTGWQSQGCLKNKQSSPHINLYFHTTQPQLKEMYWDVTEQQDNNNKKCKLNPAHTIFGVAVGSPSLV